MNKPQTLGEIGYEKWRSMLPPSARAGLPAWDRLPEGSRLGWEDVAKVIADQAIAQHTADVENEYPLFGTIE